MAETFVLSIGQGTTSTPAIIFDHEGRLAGVAQREHRQYFPHPGWVEHDTAQIWRNTEWVLQQALANQHIEPSQIASIGITSQRETCVLWDRQTGIPLGRAILWQDTRTQELVEALLDDPGEQFFRERCGIPPATYFTAPRLRWLFERDPELRRRAGAGEVLFGTMETWLIWNLTGGPAGGEHITDVTNASRTMLMNLKGLCWDRELLSLFDVPEAMLPRIVSSGGQSWPAVKVLPGVPISGVLGDQQAALFGQTCFDQGEAKCTYGTGAFLLLNTGTELVRSTNGMLTTWPSDWDRRPRSTRWRAQSPWPAPSCSGSGTAWDWFDRHLRSRRWPVPWPTTAAVTSCLPSRVCLRRTGEVRREASSPDSLPMSPRRTWPAPFARRRPGRPSTWSRR